jgi:hypothetical protein
MKFLIRRGKCKPQLKIRQTSNLSAYRIDLTEVPNKHLNKPNTKKYRNVNKILLGVSYLEVKLLICN